MTSLSIDGLSDIGALSEQQRERLRQAMSDALSLVHDALAEYPPATDANRPGRKDRHGRPMGYYERGRGWWYPVRAEATLGSKTGKREGVMKVKAGQGIAGYKLRRTSEQMGKSWTQEITETDTEIIGEVGTVVSYADFVQGVRQAALHKARGWKNVDVILEALSGQIEALFIEAII